MQNSIPYGHHDQRERGDHSRRLSPLLGVLGGVIYVIAALALMQVVFRIWIGMW